MKKLILLLLFIPLVFSCSNGDEELPPPTIKYILTTAANPSEGGTVTPATGQHNEGTTVNITAIPSGEYLFSSWSGATGTTSSTSVLMNSNKTVTANFVKKQYPLTIEIEGEGTVTEKVIKAGTTTDYNSGTVVELTAVPTGEWEFKEWKGDLTSTDNPAQITIDKAKTVNATFIKRVELTILVENQDFRSNNSFNAFSYPERKPYYFYDPDHVKTGDYFLEVDNDVAHEFSVDDIRVNYGDDDDHDSYWRHNWKIPLRTFKFNFSPGEKINLKKANSKGWISKWIINDIEYSEDYEFIIEDDMTIELNVQTQSVEEYLTSIDKWNDLKPEESNFPFIRATLGGGYSHKMPNEKISAINFFDIKCINYADCDGESLNLNLVRGFRSTPEGYQFYGPANETDHPLKNINIFNNLSTELEYVDILNQKLEGEINLANTKLKYLHLTKYTTNTSGFDYFKIEKLDFSNYTYLEHLYIRDLWRLKELILPTNSSKLIDLSIVRTKIQNLDLKNSNSLKNLRIVGTPLSTLDLSYNNSIEHLEILKTYGDYARSDYFGENNSSKNLTNYLSYIQDRDLGGDNEYQLSLSSLDFSNLSSLKKLLLVRQNLSNVDLSNNVNLTHLLVSRSNLNSINFSKSTNLEILSLPFNNITNIDLKNNNKIRLLNLESNKLSEVDLSEKDIGVIKLGCNHLTSLDISHMSTPRTDQSDMYYKFQWLEIQSQTTPSNIEDLNTVDDNLACVKVSEGQLEYINAFHNGNNSGETNCGNSLSSSSNFSRDTWSTAIPNGQTRTIFKTNCN